MWIRAANPTIVVAVETPVGRGAFVRAERAGRFVRADRPIAAERACRWGRIAAIVGRAGWCAVRKSCVLRGRVLVRRVCQVARSVVGIFRRTRRIVGRVAIIAEVRGFVSRECVACCATQGRRIAEVRV